MNATTFTVATTLAMNGDQFRCVASSSAGSATSNAASLAVSPASNPPVFALQPMAQTAVAERMPDSPLR